ncbi:bifunctional anthranilate synthase component I family protein/class IV aminotransferase [Campylobacter sp.]|uniref:bifunctional anthranilate synthase component I family protein/class IV aminotransferase n=1 Tax=Campylobacter sp. TaxID=205 RepID=UPI0026DD77D9|nr:bifunctional anthranilate synthase component I family protein/class IV aminotransferase [Campylobacter sp.]MDO4674274.1 bifunctional anthranilate synthase component I family protein/class IV aminotransferase [Campylobacter sp.]
MKNKFCVFGDFYYYDARFCLKARNQKESKKALNFIEKHKKKYFFVGFLQYEFHRYFEDKSYKSKEPYLFFYGFEKRKKFRPQAHKDDFLLHFSQNLDFKAYARNFKRVKRALARGQSYQLNLTQEARFTTHLEPLTLFSALLSRQDTPFKAYIPTPFLTLLSFSPELFFEIKKDLIITRPMKGTAARDEDPVKDAQNKAFLQKDAKNLSENVMIVDLLRNDLAKLIRKNSLQAELFEIQSYPTLHQMSSTIKGRLKKRTPLFSIFRAIFPCGSITGAPKIETMKLIKELEKRDRGPYCGAVGLIHGDGAKFSVAIRTAILKKGTYRYGVGSGVVWESQMREEFEELRLKMRILEQDFYLFETMLLREGRILFFKEHLERMLKSAQILGFDGEKLQKDHADALGNETDLSPFKKSDFYSINAQIFSPQSPLFYPFKKDGTGILRLKLFKNGAYAFENLALKESQSEALWLSKTRLSSKNPSLRHKSSLRQIYEESAFLWRENSCYDLAFLNEKNELCEASRSNLVLKIKGRFFTPTLKSGLLDGIYRNFLLRLGLVEERRLFEADLYAARELYCVNSVRGMRRVFCEKNSTH